MGPAPKSLTQVNYDESNKHLRDKNMLRSNRSPPAFSSLKKAGQSLSIVHLMKKRMTSFERQVESGLNP